MEGDALVTRHALHGPARCLLVEQERLWIGSVGEVLRITGGETRSLRLPNEAAGSPVNRIVRAQGRLWAATAKGLFWLDGERWQRFADPRLSAATVQDLVEDRDGNLWVAELAHLFRIRDGAVVERVVEGDAGLGIRRLWEDAEGNLWLGSQWNGLMRVRDSWTRRFSRAEGLDNPLLWSLAEDGEGGFWVGTDDGLSRFREGRFEKVIEGSRLPHPNAYTLLADGARLWIGTRSGLAILESGTLHEPPRFVGLRGAQINGFLRDADGSTWIATMRGLYRDDGEQLRRFGENEGLRVDRVRHLLRTRDGRLLVGTQSGLHVLREGRFEALAEAPGLPADLDVTAQLELSDGRLVLASLGETLHYFDGRRWHRLGPEQGVPGNAGFFMVEHQGWLWVAGIRGILRVPLAELDALARGELRRVRGQMLLNERGDRRGGQKGYCCNGAGLAKGVFRDGTLWAPSRDGLLALDTADVRFPDRPPRTVIERLRGGRGWQELPKSGFALGAGERDLAFEFTALDFYDPRSIDFRYRLLPYQASFREPDSAGSRVASYTNLGPGRYRFEVASSLVDGVWSEPAAFEFEVPPRFVETLAFRLLLALVVVAGIVLLVLYQRRRYQHRAAELERLVAERTAELARAVQQLREASLTDPLTSLRNRRYLSQQIPKDLAFYGRELNRRPEEREVIVFALLDIDHFKRINDRYGHAAGDLVLQQLAQLLLGQVRSGDYVARWGGEEFMVVFRPTPRQHVPALGERLCRASAEHGYRIGEGRTLEVTCSVGLVEYPLFADAETGLDWEQLVELADRALYRVKRSGRNGWGAYRPAPGAGVAQILEALHQDEEDFERNRDLVFVGTYGEAPGPL